MSEQYELSRRWPRMSEQYELSRRWPRMGEQYELSGKQPPSNGQPGDRQCRKVSPSSKRRSLSRTKKGEREERLQPMQTDQRQTSSVPSATGTVISALDWSATPGTVPEQTPRAQLHILPRLKDAYVNLTSYPVDGLE